MPKISETETNKQYVEYLERMGCFVWRNNTGVMKAGKRFVRFGFPGSGDVIGITSKGFFISVENKSNGEPVTDTQREFAARVKLNNGIALFVKSLDDLIEQTKGILR